MLTKEDLNAIGELIDTKLDEKLDKKFAKELKPIHNKLNKLQKDLTTTIRFFDNEHTNLASRVRKIEDNLHMY